LKTQRRLEFPPAGSPSQRDWEGPFFASNEQRLLGRISQKPGTFLVGGKEQAAAIAVGGFVIRGCDFANLGSKNGEQFLLVVRFQGVNHGDDGIFRARKSFLSRFLPPHAWGH
jgi:hypothetical protein